LRSVFAGFGYICAAAGLFLSIYCLLIFTGDIPEKYVEFLGETFSELVKAGKEGVSPVLLAALLMTTGIESSKSLKQLDIRIRKQFHRWELMSGEGLRLSSILRSGSLSITNDQRQKLEHTVENCGFSNSDIDLTSGRDVRQTWTRLLLFKDTLDLWEYPQSSYNQYWIKNETRYKQIQQRYQEAKTTAKYCLVLLGTPANDNIFQEAVSQCARYHSCQLEVLLRQVSDFIANAILATETSFVGRQTALKRIGLISEFPKGMTIHKVVGLFIILIVAIFASFLVLDVMFYKNLVVASRLSLISLIATNYCVAAIWATLAMSPYHSVGLPNDPPWARYVFAAGILTVLSSAILSVIYSAGQMGWDFDKAIIRLQQETYPWLLPPLTAAVTLSHLLYKAPQINRSNKYWIIEGLILGVFTSIAAIITVFFLEKTGNSSPPPAIRVAIVNFVIGALIGFKVPSWYRSTTAIDGESDSPGIANTTSSQ